MSQDELGFRADIAQSRLSRVERGYAKLSNDERERIALALGVKAEDLNQIVTSS